MALENGQDSGPVNRVPTGQGGDHRRSGQVVGDELLDFLGWKPALDPS